MSDVFVAVKRLISRSGMSAWNVAHKAGCSEATINNWLAGRVTEPHLPTLIKVARIFGKSIELTDGEAQIGFRFRRQSLFDLQLSDHFAARAPRLLVRPAEAENVDLAVSAHEFMRGHRQCLRLPG